MKRFRLTSIRFKLLFIFSTVFLILLLLLVAISRIFFESYYIESNGNAMRLNAKIFREKIGTDDLVVLGSELKMSTGGNYIVYRLDENNLPVPVIDSNNIPVNSNGGVPPAMRPSDGPQGTAGEKGMPPSGPIGQNQTNQALIESTGELVDSGLSGEELQLYRLTTQELISYYKSAMADFENGYFEIETIIDNPDESTIDDSMNSRMIYAIALKDREFMLLTKTMGALSEATDIFNSYTIRVAVVVYLVGFILLFFLSGVVTKPVRKINRVTKKMASLDFSEALVVKSSDEIGELTESVNVLAHELSHTIEELNQSNEQLNETNLVLYDTNDQLEQELSKERSLEKMRRRFVSDVSHELKNPLSMIMGYADGLKQNIPKTAEARDEYYDIILDEAVRMNKLVKDLLDLSAYESGTFTMVKARFEMNEPIEDAIERFNHINEEKDVHIEYNKAKRFEVNADRLRISQVIINIVSNAFKHVDKNGIIKITLDKIEDKTEDGVTTKTRFIVANTGPLIPEKELDLIWNSFYQVNTQNQGNGLGLAIVKSIVELHKGSCRAYVENDFNCFEVVI